ncbi:ammonium transporter [Streptomyces sp. RB6PN25]|uniref:Ammonium transporter n=2 Tax=Streptomyces humicola TaxID=2953240 RepID=A0ABT1PS22_9ACTN|nr:ammonium transporter [Streptomyces humicola]
MSLPGIAVLYGGLVQRKWVVNTMLMAFTAFSLVLVCWVLWEFKMGFGQSWAPSSWWGIFGSFIGKPGPITGSHAEMQQANIPLLSSGMPAFRFPQTTLAYFQFVFAAITPLLFLGSVIGRMSFKVWLLFVPLWSTIVYSVDAFLLWGGGWWAQKGALDYSGGYVIHLSAGVSGFVAAAVIGPRLARDRSHAVPNNLPMIAVGAGILWLGWNGFNGGDMYFGGQNAAAAVLNTNLATAVALLTWLIWDMLAGPQRKPTFLGAINGMITGLVAITPAAGFVTGYGAIFIGLISSTIVWFAWNKLSKVWPFNRVDDALGVIYTHGIAGLSGGLLVGVFASSAMAVYYGKDGKSIAVSASGWLDGNPQQLWKQAGAAATVIVWSAVMTFLILKFLGLFMKLRAPDEVLESGDLAIHDEEAYPTETAVAVGVGAAAEAKPAGATAVTATGSPGERVEAARRSGDPGSTA